MVAAVGTMAVFTVLAIAAYAMSDSNLFSSVRERRSTEALHVADAGMETAIFKIRKGGASSVTSFTVDTGNGVATVTVVPAGSFKVRVTSTGAPKSDRSVTRKLVGEVFALNLWDMIYSGGPVVPGGNLRINGGASWTGPFYMRGDWPASNGNASFNGGPFFVKDGNVELDGSAHIGDLGRVDLYCNGTVNPARVNATIFSDVPDIPLPPLDLNVSRISASNESNDGRQGVYGAGGPVNNERRGGASRAGIPGVTHPLYYKVVDNNNTTNMSAPNFTLDPAMSFGEVNDDFAMVGGVLYVRGTVFIDAPLVTLNNIRYAGRGTIVTPGQVQVNGTFRPNTMANYPGTDVLGVVAAGEIRQYSPSAYGVFYSSTAWRMNPAGNYETFNGEIVSPIIELGKHAQVVVTPNMSANMPPSLPAGDSVFVVPAKWHEARR